MDKSILMIFLFLLPSLSLSLSLIIKNIFYVLKSYIVFAIILFIEYYEYKYINL